MTVLKPGQTFGRDLRIRRLISRGGMGEVYLATREGISGFRRDVVLKVILPTLADQDNFVALFLSEARIAAKLEHRNIVSAHACGREGDLLWIEQSYVRGLNLRSLIREAGQLPVPLAVFVVAEVLSALDYAYDRPGADGQPLRVVHRDIKPANVMVSHEGEIKLTDFGIAKALGETHATKTGTIRGSAGYIAPEVLKGEEATTQSDLFCVGLLLWEALTGHALFGGSTEMIRLVKTQACVIPPLPLPISPELETILRRLLAPNPAGRYSTPGDALRELRALPLVRDVAAPELRAFVDNVAPMTFEVSSELAGANGVPVEIVDDAHASVRATGAVDSVAGTGTKTMAGEVMAPASGRAGRLLRSRAGVLSAAAVVAGTAIGLSFWLRTATPPHTPTSPNTGAQPLASDARPVELAPAPSSPTMDLRTADIRDASPPDADLRPASTAGQDAPQQPIAAPTGPPEKRQHHPRQPQQRPKADPGRLKDDYVAPPPGDG
jgi:hypothetical protein